jgi:hypothetical protein
VSVADDTAGATGEIVADAEVRCSSVIPKIDLHEALLQGGVPVDVDSDTTQDGLLAGPTLVGAACLTGAYANDAYAVLTPPPGTS